MSEPPDETRVSRGEPAGNGPAAEASLIVLRASDSRLLGAWLALGDDELTIGREEGNGLVLAADEVSRRHARIVRSGGQHQLLDLGSTNGTFVNDCPVEHWALASGDQVRIGPFVLKYLSGADEESRYHEELRRIALTDPLTGAANRRSLLEFLARETARARRRQQPLSVLLLDVDHFKRVNDTYGHLAGDEVLRGIAAAIRPLVRAEECFARHGGEEFALVLPDTPAEKARCFAERIRRAVETAPFRFGGDRLPITVSLGVAEVEPGADDPDLVLGRADARLYEAKRAGRNRVAG